MKHKLLTAKPLVVGPALHRTSPSRTKSAQRWVLLPVLLLGALLLIQAVLISIAVNDSGFAVEQNYYAKATHWDDKMRQDSANLQLGWEVVAEVRGTSQGARVEFRLKESDGRAVDGAAVQLVAFPNAHANRLQTLVAKEAPAGHYSAELTAPLGGLWEFRLEATRGTARFTRTLRLDIQPAQRSGVQ